jgi:hypothetical protein
MNGMKIRASVVQLNCFVANEVAERLKRNEMSFYFCVRRKKQLHLANETLQ